MKITSLTALILITASLATAQVTYKVTKLDPVQLGAKVDPMEVQEDFYPEMKYTEPPEHISSRAKELKEEVKKKFPRKDTRPLESRGLVDPPEIISGFEANAVTGPPTDNSLGVGDNGINISGVNRSIQFREADGKFIRNFTLNSFAQFMSSGENMYDPRVIYDQATNRYCIVWLAGNTSENSAILLAFSSADEVREKWNVYELSGSPFGTNVWTDYPMISLTNDKLILTVNLIREGEPWETGFSQTLIYQIDKANGFAGEELDVNMYSDINFGPKAIRNLHPVKSADGVNEGEQYFLSNRNFDLLNDTFFIVRLPESPMDSIEIDFRLADNSYGLPPNGLQPEGPDMQTNDARVLDAFRLENQIQFVGNTIDTASGKAAIYHGFIDDLNGSKVLSTTIVGHPERDMGYPGIAWTGEQDLESDAIIVAQHTGLNDYPGFSAIYIDQDRDCSDWIDVQSGQSHVVRQGTVSRWGDYIGCQRQYNDPGAVWVSSMATIENNKSITYNALLFEPSKPFSSIRNIAVVNPQIKLSPNPTSDRVTVSMQIHDKKMLRLAIYDMQGREVALLFNDLSKKVGLLEYSFDMTSLDSGVYLFKATLEGQEIATKKLVKN